MDGPVPHSAGKTRRSSREVEIATTNGETLVTVTNLAIELGITARTLRFYEDQGLIAPRRVGLTRVYSNREKARMILIMRGKRLGFSIKEIKEFLDLYDADPKGIVQMRALVDRIADRRRQLEYKRDAIVQALQELAELEDVARCILAKADPPRQGSTRQPNIPQGQSHKAGA